MTKAHQKFLMLARRTLLEADSLRELAAALGCARVPAGEKRRRKRVDKGRSVPKRAAP